KEPEKQTAAQPPASPAPGGIAVTTSIPDQVREKPQTSPSIDISKMEEVVLMPRLSDTMTEGVIAGWNKNVGDTIKKGDVLAEIETDKATMELESYKNGKLLYQGAKKGEKIAVNDLLAIIGEEGKVNVDQIVAAAKGGTKSEVGGQKSEASQTPGASTQVTGRQPERSEGRQPVTVEQHASNGRI